MATKEHINSYEEFKIKFLDQFWSKESQSQTRTTKLQKWLYRIDWTY